MSSAEAAAQLQIPHPPVRFHFRPRPDVASGGEPGYYRPKVRNVGELRWGRESRCQLPMSLVGVFDDIDSSLASAMSFISSVLRERASLFGSEGTNAGLARAVRAMTHCFDWGYVCSPRHWELRSPWKGLLGLGPIYCFSLAGCRIYFD
jgi:hypothetical protein